MKDKYILSIGAGKNQCILIETINTLGYKSISCDLDPNAPGKDISDIFLNISSYDYENIINEIRKLKIELVAVLTRSTGNPVLSVSKVAETFNLKGLNSNLAKILIDKHLFISKLNELDISSPKRYTIEDKDKIKYPVFVKPSKTNISHAGMNKCFDEEELKKAYQIASKYSENDEVNIEEYLYGYDIVSLDYVLNNEIFHLCSIGEISSGEPYFDGIGWYSCPCFIDKMISKNISKYIKKLNINHGFLQTATKTDINSKISKIYEVHAEIGGDLVNDIFVPHIFNGYDIFKNTINLSLGNIPLKIEDKAKASILLFREKIEEYNIKYKSDLVILYIETENYVLLDFKDFQSMYKYLEILNNTSITNQKGVKIELE